MNFNLGLTFSGLIYTILVLIIYTKRKKIKTFETIVYKNLLVITIVELLSGCISVFTVNNIENMSKVNDIINVLYLISLAGWIMVFTMYIVSIPVEQKSKFKINLLGTQR